MDATVATLLGTLIGACAGVGATLITTIYSSRNERRRLALETGYREWERMLDYAKEKGDVTVHTPALFIYMNLELLELIDDRRFTAERYREAVARHDRLREVIKHDTERRHKAGL